jgi:hypothetical protein
MVVHGFSIKIKIKDEIANKRSLATNCNLCEKNYGWLVMVMDLSSRYGD